MDPYLYGPVEDEDGLREWQEQQAQAQPTTEQKLADALAEIERLQDERDGLIEALKEIAIKQTSQPEAEPRGGYAPWAFGIGLDHGRWECAEEARAALEKVKVKKE